MKIPDNESIVVYSPDSDMIILLLLLDKHMTILRYDQQKSKLNEKLEGKANISHLCWELSNNEYSGNRIS